MPQPKILPTKRDAFLGHILPVDVLDPGQAPQSGFHRFPPEYIAQPVPARSDP